MKNIIHNGLKKGKWLSMDNGTIKILNPLQFKFYLKNGVKPIDIEIGYDNKVVYFYTKEQTREVWKLWRQCCIENRVEN